MNQEDQTKDNKQNVSLHPENQNNLSDNVQVQPQPINYLEALALLPDIQNTVDIVHTLCSSSPLCKFCGGRYYEESIIEITSLGKLNWKFDFNMPPYCCAGDQDLILKSLFNLFPSRGFTGVPKSDQPNCCCCNNLHYFKRTAYFLENELINFEFKNFGRLYIQGILVLEFQQCLKHIQDMLFASDDSTMPQMQVYQPNYKQHNKITFKAEKNTCPEHPYSLSGCYSVCNCKKLIRKFEISGLSQGDCQIINTRTSKQACYKTCGCKDVCPCDSCRYADYPNYQITFNNVTKLDKLAIIMCLIHFIMYNEWEFTDYKGIHLKTQIMRAERLQMQKSKSSGCSIF
ncbi:unnamed protein product [Paramecium octaurelia]|uniref:Uncharacterized protein n=1 Tax=Paramecium octaurelia TaxID=43137 RepID=A0A8S1VTP5_PAROT|nr:unnamed protein product [Paramecium octaurelia]